MMLDVFEKIGRRALFCLDPETAHGLSIQALKAGVPVARSPHYDERLRTTVAGVTFDNPLGMAAGYDKNAEAPDALLALGFGFTEVGTITPLPQSGNPKPRIFRLPEDHAVINRLGFNNQGHDAAEKRLAARAWRAGTVGVNIGANKDSADRIRDYELGVERFAPFASYLTVNISSPNTPGLRDMQARTSLAELLFRVVTVRDGTVQKAGRKVPIFLKIAPDLHDADLADIAAEVLDNRIEGIIVSNTTISRPALTGRARMQAGGLSGKPLFERSTTALAKMRKLLGPQVTLVGVGGVESVDTALEKIRAGADLVQLYTGMIYAGPTLPGRIVKGFSKYLRSEGLKSLAEIRDSRVDHWAETTY
ncbi:quinone-dependent dihydroorotate dehydrogenase [Mesorhizobium sp. VNQ89]|uniref:quinone-dependent dihydroorotate dehydrogenase n=1 Tax=Mesorhizobium quangtriensis TaxID=3157709 RepID=UPI0032B860B7